VTQVGSRSQRRLHAALALGLGLLLVTPVALPHKSAARPPQVGSPRDVALAVPLPHRSSTGGASDPPDPNGPPDDSAEGPSVHYRSAEEHAADEIDFEPGDRVSVPFVPRPDDEWTVDGGKPSSLSAGLATGSQMRDAPSGRAWAIGAPDDVAVPSHLTSRRSDDTTESTREPQIAGTGVALARALVKPAAKTQSTARVSTNGLRREVFGFLPYWEVGASGTVLDWRTLSTVAYFSVGCLGDGNLWKRNADGTLSTGWAGWTSSKMTSIIDAAHEHQTRVVLTVTCFAWSSIGAATQAALLGSSTARSRLARQLAAAVRDRGADGLNLDFEPIVAGYADEFTKLVRSIRAELNAIAPGYQLTFDAMGAVGSQPIAEATAPGGADAILIMGYDYRTKRSSVAGSISPLSGPAYDLADTIRAFTALVPPSKLILGVPWYGRAWSTPTNAPNAKNISGGKYGSVADPQYSQAADLLAAYGRKWDPVEQSPWTAYRKQTCTPAYGCVTSWRELYVDDARSLKLRYDLINRSSLRGAGIWALGFDGSRPELRAALAQKFLADQTPPVTGTITLPQRARDEGFRVAWTAYDDSAIRGYDVQVSIDGGGWATWLAGTTANSAVFLGTNGRTYAFRVRATDVHGNVSAWQALSLGSLGAPGSIRIGGFGTVLTDGLRLRAAPSFDAPVMTTLDDGDALQIIGGPASAGGYTWYEVAGPVRQWGPVDTLQVGGWVAASAKGVTNVGPRGAVYATRIDAGITTLRLNGGGARVLTPNGDGVNDQLKLSWTNRRGLDSLALRVYRANGTLLGTDALGASKRTAGPHTYVWDGRIGGARVPAGSYVLQLQGRAGSTTYSAAAASPVSAPQLARWGVVVGNAAPTAVVRFSSSPAAATAARAATYTITFGGPVRYLARDDLSRSGTADGCSIGSPSGSGTTWTVRVTGCSAGSLVLSLRPGAVMDAVSNWGPAQRISAPRIVIDRTAPSSGAPKVALRSAASLASISTTTGLLANLTWAGKDTGGAGIAGYDVRWSRDGAAFVGLAMGVPSASLAVSLQPGHAYRFAVRARDRAGNVGGWTAGSTVRSSLVQETAAPFAYGDDWRTGESAHYSGRFDRFSSTAGAAARYTFTGRAIAFVTTRGPDRGVVRIFLDGSLVATVDTYATSLGFRYVAWSRTWASAGTHTLKLVVAGTAGHPRVDLDALEILR
jgi:spore germination protein YaaH